MSERVPLAMYPERPSEHAESYKRALEIIARPPEFELSEQERSNVMAFEGALSRNEIPPDFEYLSTRLSLPEKTLPEISTEKVGLKTFGLDWYLKTPEGQLCLQKMGYEKNLTDKDQIKSFLAGAIVRSNQDGISDGYEESRIWSRSQLEKRLAEVISRGDSDIEEPEYLSLVRSPESLGKNIQFARMLKEYYKTIEQALRMQPNSHENEAKLLMLTLYRQRVNTQIATAYRTMLPLLNQYRLNSNSMSQGHINELYEAFPVAVSIDSSDTQKMARLFSMIDKFIEGVDRENGFSQISSSIDMLEQELEQEEKKEMSGRVIENPEVSAETRLDASQMKEVISTILAQYGLLSQYDYDSKRKTRAEDGLWTPVISSLRKSFSIASEKGLLWIPKAFSRTLAQKKPTGVLPLLDHEITHVLQHQNAANLGIELLQKDRSARGNLWFETGATFSENKAYLRYFGVERGPNLHYLRAYKTQLAGGGITECAQSMYKSMVESGDVEAGEEAVATAVDRTLRLFRHGSEWLKGSGYLTNTQPLEYAEQHVMSKRMPVDKQWLFFIGRLSFQNLAELYRIGWLKQEDVIIPNKMPSEIALEELTNTR